MALGRVDAQGNLTPLPKGDWETINATLERIGVPGGWLYRSRRTADSDSIAFVPDPAIARRAVA